LPSANLQDSESFVTSKKWVIPSLFLTLFLGRATHPASQEGAGIWLDVPFVKQSEDGCGSAAISMVLQYWSAHGAQVASRRADATTIQKQLYSPKVRGIFASDMENYLKGSGFKVFVLSGSWADLQEHLKQGRPLIVSLQPSSATAPLHYVVVTGIDWQRDAVFIHDPARGKLLRIERAEFEKQWRPNRNWMLLAVPEKAA
jgi:ABC-type bacteriocin/lantibiotic exporter with double-glycine peptidase domain